MVATYMIPDPQLNRLKITPARRPSSLRAGAVRRCGRPALLEAGGGMSLIGHDGRHHARRRLKTCLLGISKKDLPDVPQFAQ